MGVALLDPEVTAHRGSFHSRYALPASERNPYVQKNPRLLDHLCAVAASDDPEYMTPPGVGEFAVVDVVTKEKAWFEMPHGATPETVTAMIESTFNAVAYRVGNKLWFV